MATRKIAPTKRAALKPFDRFDAWYAHEMSRPLDTSPEAWERVNEGIRKMTPAERVGRAVALTILAHGVALAKIRKGHPDEDERTHRLRLAARYLEPATMVAAFGWRK